MLERLHCGIIYTGAFRDWLEAWWLRGIGENSGLIPELSFVHCHEGVRAGQSWISLIWRPPDGLGEHEIFTVGTVRLFLPRQTRTALRERSLDIRNDRMVVI
jgi:hypothetical protein